jgi:beta-mannosidase
MKQFIFIFFLLLTLSATSQSQLIQLTPEIQWRFRQADGAEWLNAAVPGCVHTDLIVNKVIKHPFYGTNEKDCQWVGEKDWVYESLPFDVEDSVLNKKVLRLRLAGIDTYADVFINEKKVLHCDNAHRSWEIDVKPMLKSSGNVMRIVFFSPISIADKALKALPYPLPGDPLRAVVRKPQFHYGWDWGPKLITCGITKPISLLAYDDARFTDIHIQQPKVSEMKAELKVTFSVHAVSEFDASISFEDVKSGDVYTTDVQLKKGMNLVDLSFDIAFPYRWWCNGQGTPTLYEFVVELRKGDQVLDAKTERTGIREIKLITEKDSIGESFYFELNGKPVFAKGANYIPIKYFPGEAKESDYRKLLGQCRDANINMLRVWGGGVYEDELFYDLCDEMGIMVWQDFMFACSMYPADSMFVANVIEEANEQTIRLRNHPCIALWCGNNENAEGWERWGWQMGLTDKQKSQIWRAYKDVFDLTLGKIVKKNTATDYWESSPRFGRGDARSNIEGDSHYWGVWHDEEPFEVLNKKVPRFMSEFGMQSFPSPNVLAEMMTGDSPSWNDPGMEQHQKHNRGFKLMDKYMQSWYPKVAHDDLARYGAMTQVVQAEGIGLGIEAQRRSMPRCMGTLYWQLNDVWPAFSWSGLDYKGEPKLLHQSLQTIYAPQLISCVVENNALNIYWISDADIAEDSMSFQFRIFDSEALPEAVNPELHSVAEPIYTSTKTGFRIRYGSHLIASVPLSSFPFKNELKNKVVEATLSFPNAPNPSFKRIQKLVYASDEFIVPVATKYATYSPKSRKKKENVGLLFHPLR